MLASMKSGSGYKNYFLGGVFLLLLAAACQAAGAEAAKGGEKSESKQKTKEIIQEALGDFIAVETGKIKAGEQIPLPYYRDGKQATRKECRYLVSPAEIPTSTTYVATSGVFYIKCSVDERGFAQVSLWQQAGTGEGIKLVDPESYHAVKKQFEQEGVSTITGEETLAAQQMRVLSEKLWVNYLVIALRSQEK